MATLILESVVTYKYYNYVINYINITIMLNIEFSENNENDRSNKSGRYDGGGLNLSILSFLSLFQCA